tara:strand:+ start:244 stop:498 length:255 start_codon:yes stop_codon:yes gene_type:complete
MKILNLIFHNFVLILEFKYYLAIMQLRLKSRTERYSSVGKFTIKSILFLLVLSLAIFLLDKIEVSVPNKLIKQEISNDKLITLK